MSRYADFQLDTYLAAAADPAVAAASLPFTFDEIRERARARMTPEAFAYVDGGAGAETTAGANLAAFGRYALSPRLLRQRAEDAGSDLGTTLFGAAYETPLLTAPVGVLEQVHEDAERALVRGANACAVPVVLSSVSSTSLEEVAEVVDRWWFQLYWPSDDRVARSFVERAERAGAEAIVVTADTPRLGWRPRDLDLAHLPFLHGQGSANYFSDPEFVAGLGHRPERGTLNDSVAHFLRVYVNRTLDVTSLARLRTWTDLPVLVKGITRADEAVELVGHGVDGIVVSNHGGRQVDNAVAALDALPAVVEAVGSSATVLFDSGVRSGADAAVALALGASAVLVGRPWIYGLGAAGDSGVEHVLRCLLAELQVTCELLGVDAAGLSADDVVRR